MSGEGRFRGEKDPFQIVRAVKRFGQVKDLKIAFGRRADHHLGGLPRRDELRCPAVAHQLFAVLAAAQSDMPHRPENVVL